MRDKSFSFDPTEEEEQTAYYSQVCTTEKWHNEFEDEPSIKYTRLIEEFKGEIMTDLGLMTYFLDIEIKQSKNEVFISQQNHTKEILKKFQMEECKAVSMLMNQKEKFSKEDGADKVVVEAEFIATTAAVNQALILKKGAAKRRSTFVCCKSEDQLANLFTKSLPVAKCQFLRHKI